MTLLQTNNFPEFTGRCCPAPCEVRPDPHIDFTLLLYTYLVSCVGPRCHRLGLMSVLAKWCGRTLSKIPVMFCLLDCT